MNTERRSGQGRRRGQLVLVAAALIAVALTPILFAYLQLGYAADVHASEDYTHPTRNAERVLERAVHDAATGIPGEYSWGEHGDAVGEVRSRLAPRLSTLASARVERGTAYELSYNQSTAAAWAREACPGGDGRSFGPCRARDGVVVQQRAGETHVVAVAFDVSVVGERGERAVTVVIRAVGGVDGR